MKKADAILCGDFHLNDSVPVARTDDYETAQWKKVDFISTLQRQHGCPVLHSGDLFEHWKPSPYLLSKTMQHLPDNFWTIYGNHDLPQHNLELAMKCGVYTLWNAGKLGMMGGMGDWGLTPDNWVKYVQHKIKGKSIFMWHVMTYKGTPPYPGCTDSNAKRLLRKYPQYDLIHTGHNHETFIETHQGKLLVNVGSLMRRKADQIDYKPCVFLYYADTNTVEKVYLPIEEGVVSREHIEVQERRDGRIDAFIESLDTDFTTTMSFEQNLQAYYAVNETKETVQTIIENSITS